jgi:hypothetical protein
VHQHFAGLNVAVAACGDVRLIVFGKRLTELQRNTAPHYANTINGVNEGFGFGL